MSGLPEVVLASPADEAEAGRRAADQLGRELGLVRDPDLLGYVEAVGARVAGGAPGSSHYRFGIVDRPEPNAFALPDGSVFVSRGALLVANSEDELACVLGHEIVHVAARHHARQQTWSVGVGLFSLPARLAGAVLPGVAGDAVRAPFAVLGGGLIAGYSRDQEREADRVGQDLAARAGYDPRALADFLARLEEFARRESGEEQRASFFDSHPTAPERVGDARARATRLAFTPATGVAADRDGYLGRIAGMLVGENPAEGLFEGDRFLHLDLDLTLVFPTGWSTVNRPAAVGAASPDGTAGVLLKRQEEGDDPAAAAEEFLAAAARQSRVRTIERGPLAVAGRPAYRAALTVPADGGDVALDLTWIAHGGSVYLVLGAESAAGRGRHAPLIAGVAGSFRGLTREERDGVLELRLRVATARAGEGVEALGRRIGNAWDAEFTGLVNGLDATGRLETGRRIKIAVRQPYAGARARAPGGRDQAASPSLPSR